MKTPSYRLDEYRETYDYYREFQPNKFFAKCAYRLIRYAVRPEVAYAPGTRETLAFLREGQVPLILPINHLSNLHDQWTSAAVADIAIPDRIGNTHVLAKDAFYDGGLLKQLGVPQSAQPVVTKFVNHMGTIPASRGKNHKDRLRLVSEANSEMFDMLGELQSRGESIALYPESTHNYTNPETLLPIRPGIGEIAIRSLQYTRPALVPIGISYGPENIQIDENTAKPAHIRRAQAYIGEVTRLDQDMSAEDVVAITAHTLQDAVNHAHALYAERTK